ncbi:MAG: c-type cytochrome [Chromatiaceae bacterium]|jgi:DMSO reductase family type II enzyme heme b subunit|nr:c-type cytochrome [Chromatiaceae bacterium]
MSRSRAAARARWARGLPALLALALPPGLAWAETPMDRHLPVALTQTAPPLDPLDPAWDAAPATTIGLFPQATAPDGPGGAVLDLEARLLWGDGRLALRLAWPDATADLVDTRATHRFADAAAVQLAPAAPTLPYVGMGEPGRPVAIWLWRAGGGAEGLSAQGFGSLTNDPGSQPEAKARRTATGWALVLRGPFSPEVAALAVAAWNGSEDGRAGRKRLSAWRRLESPGAEAGGDLSAEAETAGDPARGEQLFARHGCGACHGPDASQGPKLTHAGGIHWPGYLRRAIAEPEAFRVPGFTAVMPALPLSREDTDDLVAYLMSLR